MWEAIDVLSNDGNGAVAWGVIVIATVKGLTNLLVLKL